MINKRPPRLITRRLENIPLDIPKLLNYNLVNTIPSTHNNSTSNMASGPNTDLAALNSAVLGAKMPEITLPDGSKVQTGTVG